MAFVQAVRDAAIPKADKAAHPTSDKPKPDRDLAPVVAVVSFAAPRVGDLDYVAAMGPRTVMCPMAVLEPVLSDKYRPKEFQPCLWVEALVRDVVPQVS